MVAKSKDADWIPSTPQAKTASNRRKKSTGKIAALLPRKGMASAKGIGRPPVRMRTSTSTRMKGRAPKLSKAKAAKSKPMILKKRREARKRMSLNKLVELTRVVQDMGGRACTALNLSWTNVKRERSNTPIRRIDFPPNFAAHVRVQDKSVEKVPEQPDDHFSSGFAAHVRVQYESFENVLEEYKIIFEENLVECVVEDDHVGCVVEEDLDVECVVGSETDIPDHSLEPNTCLLLEEDMIGKDKGFDINASTEKMDCNRANRPDQNDCAATVSNSDDLSSYSSVAPLARSTSPANGCDGVNNSVIDESNDINETAAESEENVIAWVPPTPQIQAEVGRPEKDRSSPETEHYLSANNHDDSESNAIVSDSTKAASNCGQSESLIDILKRMGTRGVDFEKKPHKREKMKRHRPKVIDPSKPVKPPTPKPQTPKPARKVKRKVDQNDDGKAARKSCNRKLDFDEECCTMDQEEELKPQAMTDGSLKICKKTRMMKRRVLSPAKLNNLIEWIREQLPSECDSTSSATSTQVQEVLVTKPVIDDTIPCNGTSTQHCLEKCGNCEDEAKIPDQQENVLLIQDEAMRDALEDFVVKKMQSLCISDDTCNQLVVQDWNRCGAAVIVGEQTDPHKYHKPAVDLDRETMIAWELLTGDDWNKAAEAEALGDDVDKMKRERRLFRERLEVFLNGMHVVQGNRQFSPWKGSIVDSIVGVFLTQNVTDHLSSSAFMALVAKYPPLSLDEQNTQILLSDQQVMVVEPSSAMSEESNSVNEVEPPTISNGNESIPEVDPTQGITKGKGTKKQETPINWDDLRKKYSHGMSRERTDQNSDSVNWEAVRQASATELAKVIVDRGMNNQLAGRIKNFLDRLVTDHGSIDLEWLRNVPPPKAKNYLLSISGLGLKSTECVRLLALHFPAFPVDTNAGRFFVRVGWVPIKQLPEGVEFHQLNQYPGLDSVQKYIWPRLCDNDHPLLYEAHCHSVTVAKTFCTKTRPNCNQCPMRKYCKHYASALASTQLHLLGSQPKSSQEALMLTNSNSNSNSNSEPIIEFPPSPVAAETPLDCDIEDTGHFSEAPAICDIEDIELVSEASAICDIEDMGRDSENTIIPLRSVQYPGRIRWFIDDDNEISKALVAINPHTASLPLPEEKLKLGLKTVHRVYELPDSHPFLATFPNRVQGDPCPYLLAMWTQDESGEEATTCDAGAPCLSRAVAQYQKKERIIGTILIPCFTAMGGRFPLNGTYFQINEVFADHETSVHPINVPKELIWNLKKRDVFCGTSITSICKNMRTRDVAHVFNRSFICIRGFDKKSKAAKSLAEKFHHCKSRTPGK